MKTNPPPLWYVLGLPEPTAHTLPGDCEPLADFALRQGAAAAVPIAPPLIAVAERVRYKCQYGCRHYQRNKMCPPHTPPVAEFRRVLARYDQALLVRAAPEQLHKLILSLEREAFLLGYPFALGLIDAACALCAACPGPSVPCCEPEKARPSMAAMGIDVFQTCANAGLELRVLTDPAQAYLATGLVVY